MSRTRYATPAAAEAAFYAAFSKGDLGEMMQVWAFDDDIACVHPMSTRLQGREAIARSWQHIFSNNPRLHFDVQDAQRFAGETVAVHLVHEHIHLANSPPSPPVVATNVYRLIDGSWHMVLHHASPTPAATPKAETAPETLH